jgi:hypothetical protein
MKYTFTLLIALLLAPLISLQGRSGDRQCVFLFIPEMAATYSTLFQKDCAAGETTILIGKWAVPLFIA